MWNIAYFGYSLEMLKYLIDSPQYNIQLVVTNKERVSKEFFDIAKNNWIHVTNIMCKEDLIRHSEDFSALDAILMYKFEFIIPNCLISGHKIINFHGGDLLTNRGAHAVVWSVLYRERITCLSCYELTGGIDEGYLIDKYNIEILRDDDVNIVNSKLAEGIPYLLARVDAYLHGNVKAKLLIGGIYRPKIREVDYTIDLEADSIDIIRGKILSQMSYNGAIVNYNGKEYRPKKYRNILIGEESFSRTICWRKNSVDVTYKSDGIEIIFEEGESK